MPAGDNFSKKTENRDQIVIDLNRETPIQIEIPENSWERAQNAVSPFDRGKIGRKISLPISDAIITLLTSYTNLHPSSNDPSKRYQERLSNIREMLHQITGIDYTIDDLVKKQIIVKGPENFKDRYGNNIETLEKTFQESIFKPIKQAFDSGVQESAIPYALAINRGYYPEYDPKKANEIFESVLNQTNAYPKLREKASQYLADNFMEDRGVPEEIKPEEARKIAGYYLEKANFLKNPDAPIQRYEGTDLSPIGNYSLAEISSKLRQSDKSKALKTSEKLSTPQTSGIANPTFSDQEVRAMQNLDRSGLAPPSTRTTSDPLSTGILKKRPDSPRAGSRKFEPTQPTGNAYAEYLKREGFSPDILSTLSTSAKEAKPVKQVKLPMESSYREVSPAASSGPTLPPRVQNWINSTVAPESSSASSVASSDVGNAYDFAAGFNPENVPIRPSMAPKVQLPKISNEIHREYEPDEDEAYDNYFKRLSHRAILESMENPIKPYSEPRIAPFSPEENIAFERFKERLVNRPEIEGEHKLNTFFKRNLKKTHGMDAAERDYNLASVHSLAPGVLDSYKEPYTENIINNQRKKFQDRLDEQLKRVDRYFSQHNMINHPTHIKQRSKLLKDMEEQWLEHEQKLLKDRHNDAFEKLSLDRKHFLDTARAKSSDAQRDAQIAVSNAAQYGSHLNQTESNARQNIEQLRNYGESARMHHQGELNAAKQTYDEANAIKEHNLNRLVNAANQTAIPHVGSYVPSPPQSSPDPVPQSMWTTLGAAGGQFSKMMQDKQAQDLQRRKTEAEIALLNAQSASTLPASTSPTKLASGGIVENYLDKYRRNLLEDADRQKDLNIQEIKNFSPSTSFISGFSKSLLTRKPDQRGFESLGPAIASGADSYDVDRQALEEKNEKSRAFQRAIQNTLYKMGKDKEEMDFKRQKLRQDETYKRDLLELKKAQMGMLSGQRMTPEEKASLEIDKRKAFSVYKNGQLAQNSLDNVKEAINAISDGKTPWFGEDYTKGVKNLISKLPQQYRFNLSGNKEKDIKSAYEAFNRAKRDAEIGEIASEWTPEYGSFNEFLKSSLNQNNENVDESTNLEKKNINTESELTNDFVSKSETQQDLPQTTEEKIDKEEFIKTLPKMSKDKADKVFAIFEKAQKLKNSAEDAFNDVKKIIKAVPKGAASGISEKEGYLSSLGNAGMALLGSKAINKAAKEFAPLILDKLPVGKTAKVLKKGVDFISKATDIPFNFKDVGKFGASFVLGDRIAKGIQKESGVSDNLFIDFLGMSLGSGITSAVQVVGKNGANGILKGFEKLGLFDPKKYDQYIKDGIDPTLAMVAKTDEAKNKIQNFMEKLGTFSPAFLPNKKGIKGTQENIEKKIIGDTKTLNTEGYKSLQEGTKGYLKESYDKASEWQNIINSELKRVAEEKAAKGKVKDIFKSEFKGYKPSNTEIANLKKQIEKLPATDPSKNYVETFLDGLNKKGVEIDFNALRKAEEGIGKIVVSGATPLERDNAKKVAKELNESVKNILKNTSDKAIDAYEKRQAFYKEMFEKTPKKATGKSRDAFDLESKYDSKAFQDKVIDEFKNDHRMLDFRIEKASPEQVKKFGEGFINQLGWNEEKSAFDLTKLVKEYSNFSDEQRNILNKMYSKANPNSDKSFNKVMDIVKDYKIALEAASRPLHKTAVGNLPIGGGLAIASQVLPARLKMLLPTLLVKIGAESIMYNPSTLVKLSKASTKYEFSKVFSKALMESKNKLSDDEIEKATEIKNILEEVKKKTP